MAALFGTPFANSLGMTNAIPLHLRSVHAPSKTVDDLNRTQMMTLPPAEAWPTPAPITEGPVPLPLSKPPRERLSVPAVAMAVGIALVLFTLTVWFVRQL